MEIYRKQLGDDLKELVFTVAEQYYRVDDPWGNVEIVRRHSKCTSGYMRNDQLQRIAELEQAIVLIKKIGEDNYNANGTS